MAGQHGGTEVKIERKGKSGGHGKVHKMEITMTKNGGHIMTPHHMQAPRPGEMPSYNGEPQTVKGEPMVFSKDQGHEAHKHIEKMTGMKMPHPMPSGEKSHVTPRGVSPEAKDMADLVGSSGGAPGDDEGDE